MGGRKLSTRSSPDDQTPWWFLLRVIDASGAEGNTLVQREAGLHLDRSNRRWGILGSLAGFWAKLTDS